MKSNPCEPPVWFPYCFFLFTAAFLYLVLFILPATPEYLAGADQYSFLYNATRMLRGEMIYRDFFQFTAPGTELLYFALFKLIGVHAWIPNAMLVVLGFSLTWVCVSVSRKVLSGVAAYLPGLLFLLAAFYPNMDGSHHWYSTLAVTAAVALVIEKRNRKRVAGAAAFCALASFFTQTRGVCALFGLALFLWWENRMVGHSRKALIKIEALLAGVFSTVIVGLNLYFVWVVGLKSYLWHTVIFVVRYFPADSPQNSFGAYLDAWPSLTRWYHLPALLSWLFLHLTVPLIYILFFARFWRESKAKPEQPWDRLMLVNLLGLSTFAGIAPAATYPRICTVALPGLIILVWFLRSGGRLQSLVRQMLWLGAGIVLTGYAVRSQTRWRGIYDAPAGRLAVSDPQVYEGIEWLGSRTHPGQLLFDCNGQVYFPLGLQSPAEVQFLSDTDYLRPEQARNVIDSLERHRVEMVLWCLDYDPGVRGFRPDDHLGPLREYLQTHYHAVKIIENSVRVLERNEGPAAEQFSEGAARSAPRNFTPATPPPKREPES